jgi:uroporphyrinogen-III decarboxylase
MDTNWSELTPEQKKKERFQWWLNPQGVDFVSAEAGKAYKQRVQRFIDAYNVEEPDRVPVSVQVGAMPAYMYGIDYYTAMRDYDKTVEAWVKFNEEHSADLDCYSTPAIMTPGKVYDHLDYKLYSYPGHGLPTDAQGVQFVEGEYMKKDEYDALIRNPSDYWMRVYMPRAFGALKSFTTLSPFTDFVEMPAMKLVPFTRPEVQAGFQALIDAGKELSNWLKMISQFSSRSIALGYPQSAMGAFCKAPFDTLGDTLRGTRGIMMDMYRQPEKLLEAMDVMADLTIESTISSLNAVKGFKATFPLHKGADGWMSDKQFDTLYWPPLKKVINALIEEGILVNLFAEGSYNTRLESVNEFPKGAVTWLFDKTDIVKAKKILGDKCCISGNVPSSAIVTWEPQRVKDLCRNLIEECGKGGGYILSPGAAGIDEAKLENIKAMVSAAREFGVYKK